MWIKKEWISNIKSRGKWRKTLPAFVSKGSCYFNSFLGQLPWQHERLSLHQMSVWNQSKSVSSVHGSHLWVMRFQSPDVLHLSQNKGIQCQFHSVWKAVGCLETCHDFIPLILIFLRSENICNQLTSKMTSMLVGCTFYMDYGFLISKGQLTMQIFKDGVLLHIKVISRLCVLC